MKLVSYRFAGRERFGAVVDDLVIDLTEVSGLPTLASFVGSADWVKRDALVEQGTAVPLSEVVLLPVIPRPEKVVCSVRNYLDHHQEAIASGLKRELSEFPPIFLRVWRSQVAHDQPIIRPHASESLDWEGELAVIIGVGGRDIPIESAWNHVAGYSCYNDGSVREFQFHAKQIAAGKNFESTGGFGPWMVTSDEIAPGRMLKLETRLNGEVVQSGDTSQMIFDIPQLINYASTIFTLAPGDVILTGTPSGVGFSRKPPRYLKPGDVVEVEIEGIGVLRNPVAQQAMEGAQGA
ncbi:MAG TPA: fumarylacetoacetate hydrolase family protein [Kineosporiaceae bacterium]|nr:fumarylacetoacetate hydrolase family protein [Kineosporiaceae bacterium]